MNRKSERGKKMAVGRKGKISKGEEEADTHTLAYRESERERERERGRVDAELYRSLLSSACDVTDVPHQRWCDDTLVLRSQTIDNFNRSFS